MSEAQRTQQPQSEVDMALSYLAEVANTYSKTLDPVALGPFVNHVNNCFALIRKDRVRLLELVAASDTPDAGE